MQLNENCTYGTVNNSDKSIKQATPDLKIKPGLVSLNKPIGHWLL